MALIRITLLFLSLLAACPVYAATYFIDYNATNDSGAATKLDPWKRCPGMAGFSGSYYHLVGDIFIFKGGVTWPSAALPLTISNSGSAENIDTYTTDNTWHIGGSWTQPVFDGQSAGKNAIYIKNKGYIKINDLKIINTSNGTSDAQQSGVSALDSNNIDISNCTFVTESWKAIYLLYNSGGGGNYGTINIFNNNISYVCHGINLNFAASGQTLSGFNVYNNNIHDFSTQITSSDRHGDGIFVNNSADYPTSYCDNIKIYNNYFYGDCRKTGVFTGGAMTAWIYLSSNSQGALIYNNIFTFDDPGVIDYTLFESFMAVRDYASRGGGHKILNNTFYAGRDTVLSAGIILGNGAPPGYPSPNTTINNNILSNIKYVFDIREDSLSGYYADYNDIDYTNSAGKWSGTFYTTLAQWQTILGGCPGSGNDCNSITANPDLNTDYTEKVTSPTVNAGTSLSTVFTTDKIGTLRHQGSAWDIGAYEYSGGNTSMIGVYNTKGMSGYYNANGMGMIGNVSN